MTFLQLEQSLRDTLATSWRMRAGIAAYQATAPSGSTLDMQLTYVGLPVFGSFTNLLVTERTSQAFAAVQKYIHDQKLNVDVFYSFINQAERYLSSKLTEKSISSDGTFGTIQKKAENAYPIPTNFIERIDEIRERRNSIVHHNGQPTQKHNNALGKVFSQNGGAPINASPLKIDIRDEYLPYCADCIISYAKCF